MVAHSREGKIWPTPSRREPANWLCTLLRPTQPSELPRNILEFPSLQYIRTYRNGFLYIINFYTYKFGKCWKTTKHNDIYGAMLAKGWLLGLQFEALFEDDLYWKIAKHANQMADLLRNTLQELGYQLVDVNSTNQVFVVMPNSVLAKLEMDFSFSEWEKLDRNYTLARFCTSWATKKEAVDALCERLKQLSV